MQLSEISLDASDKELDDAAVLAVLHNLYSMTFTPQGKEAMVYVFTLNENISVLLPFIEMTGAPPFRIYIGPIEPLPDSQCYPT